MWAHNLHEEIRRLAEIVDDYPYIAMDTEFPGVVARPVGNFKTNNEYQYQTLKCNVDLLKIIQLGLCFCDSTGKLIPGSCTWQFNFKFSLSEDMYAQDSIDLLNKSGIDFKDHERRGIDVNEFAELLMTSGIVLNEDVRWISFHSGYDFGYLLKLLTAQSMPPNEQGFFDLLTLYFPLFYDVKFLMNSCNNLNGGLQKVAEQLSVERIGPQHQAGSDALLTALTFFKMRELYFNSGLDDEKVANQLFGLGLSLVKERKPVETEEDEPISAHSASNASQPHNNNSVSAYQSSGQYGNSSNAWQSSTSGSSAAFPGLLPSSKFMTPDMKAKKKSQLIGNGNPAATPPDFSSY